MSDVHRCPTCNQRWPGKQIRAFARICRVCTQPIRTHHKYAVHTDGAASWLEHRNCEEPSSYGDYYPHAGNPPPSRFIAEAAA